jgi:cyclophilin family peptidyl-prolyl cis-trans isomerase
MQGHWQDTLNFLIRCVVDSARLFDLKTLQENMSIFRFLTASALALALTGCFQLQLGGSVGNATLTVAPLNNTSNIVASGTSQGAEFWIAAQGQQAWEDQGPLVQLLLLGISNPKPTNLAADALYIATASGGTDYDPTASGGFSDNPLAVQGSWRMIATGQHMMDGNLKVSSLTEALYLMVEDYLGSESAERVMLRLHAAAEILLEDIDGDGSVDYNDALRFNRTLDGAAFKGDLAALDALASAIANSAPQATLRKNARNVLGSSQLVMETNFGTITMRTLNWEAPVSVANFLRYVAVNFYDQTIFHRTMQNFMIQGGYWELVTPRTVDTKDPMPDIINEASNGVLNLRGNVAMARLTAPDTANSQFFINQINNDFLDYDPSTGTDGYAVFAAVTSGMDVVDTIAALPTQAVSGIGDDVPRQIVSISSVTRTD